MTAATQILLSIAGGDWAGPEIRRSLGREGASSRIVMLNGHGRGWRARSGGGAFSVKWVPRGRVGYRTEGAAHPLAPEGFLLMNPGQPYDMAFQGAAETFCLFFSDDLVREAWGSTASPLDDDGEEAGGAPAEFPNLVFRPRAALGRAVAGLYREMGSKGAWPADVEARLLDVLALAVAQARAHRGEAARAPALRAATRARLRARLEVARRLILEGEGESLDQVAMAAGLSKFHLVRLFRAVFGTTPMRYAEGVRLDRAAEALKASGRPLVDEIAFAAGYESASAFGRAFRRRFGVSPTAWRAG